MILVNNAGDGKHTYAPLLHAEWHGWTFTDIIFPSFLWIVGVAITLSFARRVEQGADRKNLLLHALKRSALIYVLALLLAGYPHYDLSTIRVVGVLHRIAICAALGSAIYLYTRWKTRVAILVLLLGVYWALMTLVPVPGYGAGDLSVEGNFEHYVDGLFLQGHMYHATKTWDPEGIVSTLPALGTLIFGLLTGEFLRSRRTAEQKALWLFAAGIALLVLGEALGVFMPINKKLWTTPFAIFMAGISTVLFACCYWSVDARGWRRWTKPFVIFGMNSLFVYILSEWLSDTLSLISWTGADGKPISAGKAIFYAAFAPLADPYMASLLFAIAYVAVCFLAAWVMYRKRWFLRL